MAKDIAKVIARSRDTLVGDTVGAIALIVILFAGLSLPGAF